ncbi:MAG: periplasmic heavy metal sensor [Pseudomonadota bacterium]
MGEAGQNGDQEGAKALRRGPRILLYVSLLMNLIVIGVVIGALINASSRAADERPPRAGETGLGPVILALEPSTRRALGFEMRRALRGRGRDRGQQRAITRAMISELRAEPFSSEAVSSLLDQQISEAELRLTIARDLFVEHIIAMSEEDRAAYAARLEAELEKRRGPPRDGTGRDEPPRERSGREGSGERP